MKATTTRRRASPKKKSIIPPWFQASPKRTKPAAPDGEQQLTKSGIAELEELQRQHFNTQLDTLQTQSFRLNCTLRAQLHEVKQLSGKHVSQRSQAVRRLSPEQMAKRSQLVGALMRNIKRKSYFTELMPVMRDKGPKIFACDRVNLWLYKTEKNVLETILDGGSSIIIEKGKDLVGSVTETGVLCNLASAAGDRRFLGVYDQATGYVTASVCIISCIDDFGRPLAVIEMLNKKLGRFDVGDEKIARKICRSMAMYLR